MDAEEHNAISVRENIHPVCLLCKKSCKQPYSFWSFQMPPEIFCEDFEEGERNEKSGEVSKN